MLAYTPASILTRLVGEVGMNSRAAMLAILTTVANRPYVDDDGGAMSLYRDPDVKTQITKGKWIQKDPNQQMRRYIHQKLRKAC